MKLFLKLFTAAALMVAGLFGILIFMPDEPAVSETEYTGSYVPPSSQAAGTDLFTVAAEDRTSSAESATVLIYMNGSNLESDYGEASDDIQEMLDSGCGENVNVVIETLSTKEWQNFGISSSHTQRYLARNGSLELVDDSLGQQDCTQEATLSEFIEWGAGNYPADRYILILWNHGGGSVYGFGYNEAEDDETSALTLDEMQSALKANSDVYFDLIGMDCCIMSSLEVCSVLSPFCDYTILSEEFESGIGWEYTTWLSAFEKNVTMPTDELGKYIVDAMVGANETSWDGDTATLAVIDEMQIAKVYAAWTAFAYENEEALLNANYSTYHERTGKGDYGARYDDVALSDYYLTDIMAVAGSIDSESSAALASALSQAIVYYDHTDDVGELTGMCVTLPYGDSWFYTDLQTVFANCGFDSDYITWLGKFVDAEGSSSYYSFDDFEEGWDNWDSYDDEYDWSDFETDEFSDEFFNEIFGSDSEGSWSDYWDDEYYWEYESPEEDDWYWSEDWYEDDPHAESWWDWGW